MLSNLIFYVPVINVAVATASLVVFVLTIILGYALWQNRLSTITRLLQPWLWLLIIGTSLGGVALSLLYSEIFLFVPCSLCWLQRVALYPQAIMAVVAWRRGDTTHFPAYGIALSVVGLLVAIYHYVYQLIPTAARETFTPCLVDGSADCGEKIMNVYGFVTFPLTAAITFAFLIVLYLCLARAKK
jgi:disulfide bond formation protein DsbB